MPPVRSLRRSQCSGRCSDPIRSSPSALPKKPCYPSKSNFRSPPVVSLFVPHATHTSACPPASTVGPWLETVCAPRACPRVGNLGALRGGLPKTGRRSPALDAYETVVYSLYCVAERPATSSYKLHAYHRCDIPPLRTRGISMLCLGGHFERLVALKESNAGTASSTAILPVRSARATRFGNVAIMHRLCSSPAQ